MDGLHGKSGLSSDKVINAHGTGTEAQCAICKSPYNFDEFDLALRAGTPIYCAKCNTEGKRGPIKPSVVFFNEPMPTEFREGITEAALS